MLCLPRVTEACPHGLAPTTSTLMQLAMGDALAVALLEARGFTADHFQDLPPGRIARREPHPCARDHAFAATSCRVVPLGHADARGDEACCRGQALRLCRRLDDEGPLAGIITDGDLSRNLHRNLVDDDGRRDHDAAAEDRAAEMLASAALGLLNEHNIGALIVTEKIDPVGIVHFHDLLRIGAA